MGEKGGRTFHVKITCKRIVARRIMGHLAIRTNILLLGDHRVCACVCMGGVLNSGKDYIVRWVLCHSKACG